jgi:uncharacterized protein (TIRG00374 family)
MVRWRAWLRLIQLIVTIALIWFLLQQVRLEEWHELTRTLNWSFVALSTVFVLLSHLLNIARWQFLLQHTGPSYSKLLIIYGAGLFSNSFLPTGIGGDGVRVALLSRDLSLPKALFSVAWDRAIGILALSALVILGLYLDLPPDLELPYATLDEFLSDWPSMTSYLFVVLVVSLLVGFFLWKFQTQRSRQIISLVNQITVFQTNATMSFKHWLYLLSGGYLISLLSHLGLIVAHWSLFQALQLDIPPIAALWLVLLGSGALLLPISINGLGLQESIYVYLLTSYGILTAPALGVAFLIRMLMLFYSLLGGVLSLGWHDIKINKQGSNL